MLSSACARLQLRGKPAQRVWPGRGQRLARRQRQAHALGRQPHRLHIAIRVVHLQGKVVPKPYCTEM